MNKLDIDYQNLLRDILDNGVRKNGRNGETLSVFGRQIRHKMSDGFPLLTTKKMAFKSMVAELLWFLRGDTNIKYLADNNCHFWDLNAYQQYVNATRFDSSGKWMKSVKNDEGEYYHPEPYTQDEFIEKIKDNSDFAERFGELGPIYGAQWRKWRTFSYTTDIPKLPTDQIKILINNLKTNPDSRRLIVNAWNPTELDHMALVPCHYSFQCWTRELSRNERIVIYQNKFTNGLPISDDNWTDLKLEVRHIPTRAISLIWNQRSVDTPLGLPMNVASYGLLLTMIAKQVNMIPEDLIGNLGDTHIYVNQIDGVTDQLLREPYNLPKIRLSQKDVLDISEYEIDDIELIDYESHDKIKFPLS